MKRFFAWGLLTTGCWLGGLAIAPLTSPALGQVSPPAAPSYQFFGRAINLRVRRDVVAVDFKATGNTRGRGGELPLLRLQRDLARQPRGGPASPTAEVHPLGQQYALVRAASGRRSGLTQIEQQVKRLSYVDGTLPVLSRRDRNDILVLPNEIILSFDPDIINEQAAASILNRYQLEVLRPVPFSKTQVIVRATQAQGLEVLTVAQRLERVHGIRSATPNFIQSLQYTIQGQDLNPTVLATDINAERYLKQQLDAVAAVPPTPSQSLVPLQWHLDSRPKRGLALPRTDIRATEAWDLAQNDGDGVVVAVIDSLIQWDHPDLDANLYKTGSVSNKLPGEQYGWDFADNDPDTRISQTELEAVRPAFQETFQLSDPQLLGKFKGLAQHIGSTYPGLSQREIALYIRNYIRRGIAAEFHGTWSAGVVAAHGQGGNGLLGVAPNAKILPVRVFGLGGAVSLEALMGSVRYAAARKVDVINLSLGGPLPFPGLVETFFDVLDNDPHLVIVASAGNSNVDGVSFPAAIPGVLSVGATNLPGQRTFYSSYGGHLDVVAPGGDTSQLKSGGILTTGGTFAGGFWQGITLPTQAWGSSFDAQGKYVQVQGTSFSAPAVAGVIALMKGEDPQRRLTRDQLIEILQDTANHQSLQLTTTDQHTYRLQRELGFGTAPRLPYVRPSGVFPSPEPRTIQEYYYGYGLVNAAAAVQAVQNR